MVATFLRSVSAKAGTGRQELTTTAMKQVFYYLLLACIIVACNSDKKMKLVEKIRTMPSFDVLLTDSVTVFNTSQLKTGVPTMLLYFDPDCHTCQAETEMLKKHIQDFGQTQILFLSISSTARLKKFITDYGLQYYPTITVVRDHKYSVINVFKLENIPSAILYDKEKRIARIYEGAPTREEIIKELKL